MKLFVTYFEEDSRSKRTLLAAVIMLVFVVAGMAGLTLIAEPVPDEIEPPAVEPRQDDSKSFEQCRKDAESGIPAAQYELSVRYALGNGVERDEAKAAEWCQKAAADYPDAQFEIGYKYYTGNHGVTPPDYAKALEWYKKAADSGYAEANYKIGVMYQYGEGVKQDDVKALEYFHKGVATGCRISKSKVDWMHRNGKGIDKDEDVTAAPENQSTVQAQ